MQELDERKQKILHAIIQNYLETGEPVGSRTISKYADLGLSSATIRNEMSDLEEMGYIIQPHTSAGRIPSDMGYRFYVDQLMKEKEQEVTEMKELMIQRQDKMELVLKQMAKVLAANTNYATMITSPQYHRTKLKFIQLSVISEDQLLAVVVAEGNVVKNKVIPISHGLDNETFLKLNILLNTSLNRLTMEEINLSTIAKLRLSTACWMRWQRPFRWMTTWRFTPAVRRTFSSTRSWRTARRPALSSVPLRISSSSQASWKT